MSIPDLKRAANGVYYVHWSDGGRSKRISARTTNLATAKAFLGTWLLMENTAPTPEDAAATLTVEDLWTVYYKKYVTQEVVGLATADYVWKNLKVAFGDKHLHQINQTMIDTYEKNRAAGKIGKASVSSTVRRELVVLRSCFNYCADVVTAKSKSKRRIEKRLITPNDIPQFALPEERPARDRWHTHEEMQKLHEAAAEISRAGERLSRGQRFLWLALETGARVGAILDLTWDRVDFERRVIHYNVPGRRVTKKKRTSVPISEPLLAVLQRAYAERLDQKSDAGLVMDNKAKIWKTIQAIATAAGVTKTFPNAMRHTAGTQMARGDVPLWKVSKVLGNSLAMVERVYAKHTAEDLRESVGAISKRAPAGAKMPVLGVSSELQRDTTSNN